MTANRSEPATRPFWVSALLDFSADDFERGSEFWSAATGYTRSESRGENDEFGTLLPAEGDAHLRLQRLAAGATRIHLDLHVADPRAAADVARGLGATEMTDRGYVVLTSPGGLTFCFVDHPASTRATPHGPAGGASLVDQVCLDISPASYGIECAFWRDLTTWPLHQSPVAEEFAYLERPAGQPFRFLLQRLGEGRDRVEVHLDLSSENRAVEVARHEDLGATSLDMHPHFTVLRDPVGSAYCITDRDPRTGVLDLTPKASDENTRT